MSYIDEVVTLLRRSNCLRRGEFTLSSGRKTRVYIDLRSILSHPKEFKMLVSFCNQSIKGLDFEVLAGVESSGIPLATALALENDLPMIYVRKEAKAHGLGKIIEGDFKPGRKVLVVDDVATTGSSLARAVEALRSAGLLVSDAFTIVDRREGAGERLASLNVKLTPLITLDQILSRLNGGGSEC
ncbi:MAG: orotate phosphoribosyltransferase [Thaumarchaeota archaeon]|nr:orotate phosphoribosyltransferase [Nitrososphaerota archaeon]